MRHRDRHRSTAGVIRLVLVATALACAAPPSVRAFAETPVAPPPRSPSAPPPLAPGPPPRVPGSAPDAPLGPRDRVSEPNAPAGSAPRRPPRAPTEAEIVAAFGRGDYVEGLRLVELALQVTPDDPLLHYNAACALALMGRPNDAADRLMRAVTCGFRDFQHLERDPDLDSIRDHPTYQAILEARARHDRDAAKSEVDRWRSRFGEERYRYERDEHLNLHFATALEEPSYVRMREMLTRQADQQIGTLFAAAPREAVFIAVPTTADSQTFFRELAARDATFNSPNVGGIYEHRPRRLVSTDIGASLRHEFTHALHYGDMERLGQPHPLWIQEGLATLYETYDLPKGGEIIFLANDRDDVIRGLVKGGGALPWARMLVIGAEDFMKRPQQLYPQVRSMFRFLAERKKLAEWYKAYTRSFATDPTGRKAFEQVFASSLEDIERDWRRWVSAQRSASRVVGPGDASLGVSIDDEPDGARITQLMTGSAASRAGLRRGDVIISVDEVATSSAAELVSAIAKRRVGEAVRLQVRRGAEVREVVVRLEALRM